MKEQLEQVFGKIKSFAEKLKKKADGISLFHQIGKAAVKFRTAIAITIFLLTVLTVILVAILGMKEFVVQVCILVLLEVGMAILLHHSEVWIHALVLALHVIAAFALSRLPLTLMCALVYLITIFALAIGFSKKEKENE